MKKLTFKLIILIIILIWNNFVFGEIELLSTKVEDEEDIQELYTEGKIDYDDYQTLNYLYQHPIDLNKADIFQLQEVPGITFELAQKIYNNRPFKNPELMASIIGKELFDQIKNFIQVKDLWKGDFNFWMTDTQDDNKKAEVKTRLCIHTKEVKFGVFGKRGKKFKLKKRYLMVENLPFLKKVIVGNYQMRFGEGIVLNTARRKNYHGVIIDDSDRKSDSQDGVVIETPFDRGKVTIFYSWVDLDKFPNPVLSTPDGKEKLWGCNLTFVKGNNLIGATSYTSNLTSKNEKNKRIEMLGVNLLRRFESGEIACEIARSKKQGKGWIFRGYKKIGDFKYWLSLRRYEQDFINPHSMVKKGDEKGGYAKIEYDLNGLKFKIFCDYHKHFSTLTTDEKYWTSMEYKLSPKAKLISKIEYEDKDVVRSGNEKKVYYLKLDTKPHFKLHITPGYHYTNKNGKVSDYVYIKGIYYFNPHISLTGRFKYGPEEKREGYTQVKIKMHRKELIAKYTHTPHKTQPHKFHLRMKMKW